MTYSVKKRPLWAWSVYFLSLGALIAGTLAMMFGGISLVHCRCATPQHAQKLWSCYASGFEGAEMVAAWDGNRPIFLIKPDGEDMWDKLVSRCAGRRYSPGYWYFEYDMMGLHPDLKPVEAYGRVFDDDAEGTSDICYLTRLNNGYILVHLQERAPELGDYPSTMLDKFGDYYPMMPDNQTACYSLEPLSGGAALLLLYVLLLVGLTNGTQLFFFGKPRAFVSVAAWILLPAACGWVAFCFPPISRELCVNPALLNFRPYTLIQFAELPAYFPYIPLAATVLISLVFLRLASRRS